MDKPIRTLIYEDNPELREGMSFLLRAASGIELVGAFPDCRQVAQEVRDLRPDVILMDIEMPGANGIEATAIARAVLPSVHVIMLTIFEDEQRIFDALRNGAMGYLLKETPPWEVVNAVFDVVRGGSPMTARVARRVLRFFHAEGAPEAPPDYGLSPRELDLLRCLVEGHSYKQAADQLFISVETVRSHIRRIYEKLQVHSKTEAVLKALREKLT